MIGYFGSSYLGGSTTNRLPPGATMLMKNVGGEWVDVIGLSISELYPLVDPALQSIISADGGITKRADADIVTLFLASPLLNIPGGTLFYDVDFGIVLYADGQQPIELAERRLWRKLFGTQFEAMTDNGEAMTDDGYQLYEVANA